MTHSITQLVERRFTEDEIVARAAHDITRKGHRHPDWYAGDPYNCAGCALAIELAEQDCQTPRHRHTVGCWEDKRCPDHVGSAP